MEESQYVMRTGSRKIRAGFTASVYELTTKAYLAILLNSVDLDGLLRQADESTAQTLLSSMKSIMNASNLAHGLSKRD